MRSQAIEKLAKKICKQFNSLLDTYYQEFDEDWYKELKNSVRKMEILTDRTLGNNDRASSVIREVMNQ